MLYFISKKNKITFQSPEVSKGTFVILSDCQGFRKIWVLTRRHLKNAGFFINPAFSTRQASHKLYIQNFFHDFFHFVRIAFSVMSDLSISDLFDRIRNFRCRQGAQLIDQFKFIFLHIYRQWQS